MKKKSLLSGKVQFAFGTAILALLVVGAISYRAIVVSSDSNLWVRHTHEVIENLEDLRAAMQMVESSARGYLLTGNESFLESYHAGVSKTQEDEALARRQTVDNDGQQRRLSALELLTAQNFTLAEKTLNLRRTVGSQSANSAILVGSGKPIIDDFQSVTGEMRSEELRLLQLRDADAQRRLNQIKIVLVVGTVLCLLVVGAAGWSALRDQAARAVAEAAQREGEDRFRTLANNMPQLAWMADEKGSTFWYNERWFDYTGTTLDEMKGWGWQKVHHPDHVKRVMDKITRCFQLGKVWEDTFPLRGRDGNYRLFLSRTVPIRSPEGKILRWIGTNTDISESKESGAKYRGLLEAAPDAMVVVNQAGEIVLLNVQAEKQFGYRRDELVGQKVKNIIPEGFAERLVADALRSTEDALAQQIGAGIELSGRRKNGSNFPIEIMLSPLESTEGTLVTAAIRDITARKKDEAHLLDKVEELNRSNEELGQFAYIASHDLQEPLRMVASYTQLLARRYKGKLDADADEFISFAVDGASRMQWLIQDLLAYSRVGTKGQELLETSSEESLRRALVNLRGAIEESGAQVTHDPLPAVLADETQLIQLFQNLIGNGIKYQGAGIPKVHISASRNGGEKWIFSVKDNGLGIDPQYFEKIFGMFQRLHKREEFAGTGIGLAICKKIVERHGGSISVESKPGQGATFSFALAGNEKKS